MKKTISAAFAVILAASTSVSALEWQAVGPRALGMGGTGVATVQGPLSSYWNPAALGRATENAYGLLIPVGMHAGVTGSVVEGAKDLQSLKGCTSNCNIAGALSKFNHPGDGVRVDVNSGANLKMGRLAIFANGFGYMGAVPRVDMAHTTQSDIDNNLNTSKLIVKGIRIIELGAGYGRELSAVPGVYLGGNLKLMNGQVGYADYLVLQHNDNTADINASLKNGAQTSSSFGVDAGALWDVTKTFDGAILHPRVGLVGRNLNSPKFQQPPTAVAAGAGGKFAVKPQARLGLSLTPFHWWNLAADLDVTRNQTPVDNVASRQLGVGTEINIFNRSWINIPLRAGLSRNLAESGSGTMLSAGAGLNFLHIILDFSGSVSPKTIDTQSQGKTAKIPREVAAAFQLSILFGGSEDARRESSSKPTMDESPAAPPAPPAAAVEQVKQNADNAQKALDAEAAKPAVGK